MTTKKDSGTHVRISWQTRERLVAIASSLSEMARDGRTVGVRVEHQQINPAALGVSMDEVIRHLLDMRDKHRERSRKAARARKQKQSEE